jgi:hypothetical protein
MESWCMVRHITVGTISRFIRLWSGCLLTWSNSLTILFYHSFDAEMLARRACRVPMLFYGDDPDPYLPHVYYIADFRSNFRVGAFPRFLLTSSKFFWFQAKQTPESKGTDV